MILILALSIISCTQKGKVTLVTIQESPREKFAVEKLAGSLKEQGYEVVFSNQPVAESEKQIVVGDLKGELFAEIKKSNPSLDT